MIDPLHIRDSIFDFDGVIADTNKYKKRALEAGFLHASPRANKKNLELVKLQKGKLVSTARGGQFSQQSLLKNAGKDFVRINSPESPAGVNFLAILVQEW